MANFDGAAARLQSARDATNLLQLLRATYATAKQVRDALTLYQAGTDPIFNAAVNALFSASERSEIGAMAAQLTTLVSDWEAQHAGAIGVTL